MVSFGEDYITNLVKLTTLFYLYFRSHKCLHTGAYLGTGLQPCQSIFVIIRYLQVPAEIRLDARTLLVSCGSFSMIRFCLLSREAHLKQETIKWTISGGQPVPLLWGPQIRPPALPLENRHRTQRKLLSAALPHLAGLSCSASYLPPSLSLLSFTYILSVEEIKCKLLSTARHCPSPGYHGPSLTRILRCIRRSIVV